MFLDEFRKRLEAVNAGMLCAGAEDWLVPKAHSTDPDRNAGWFITARETDVVDTGPSTCHCIVAGGGKGLFAQQSGHAEPVGKDDPDLPLLAMAISGGEVRLPALGLNFVVNVARAQLTGDQPDIGKCVTL